MFKKFSLLFCVGMLVVLQGCAGFAARDLPTVGAEQLRPAVEKQTKIFTRWKVVPENSNAQVAAAQSAVFKKKFEEVLAASNCCSIVESLNDADLIVDGTSYNENNPAAMIGALITGFSLYTIPSWVTSTEHVSVEATRGGVKKTYEAKDSMTMVQWLPMALMFPFANPFPMEKEMSENVHRNILLKMKNDGLI